MRMPVQPDAPIRILVVGLSTLVQDLIEAVSGEDIELIDAPASIDLVDAIRQAHADYVLLPLSGSQLPMEVKRYLTNQAHVRVIGVEEAEGHALLYQLVPEVRELGEVAPVELVDAIRGNVSYSTEII